MPYQPSPRLYRPAYPVTIPPLHTCSKFLHGGLKTLPGGHHPGPSGHPALWDYFRANGPPVIGPNSSGPQEHGGRFAVWVSGNDVEG